MQHYTVGGAFSEATAFLKENLANILLLFGTAIVIGQAVQGLLIGGAAQTLPTQLAAEMRAGNMGAGMGMFGAFFAAIIVASILQSAAQFAVLRQGLSQEKDIGSTLIYGLVATIVSILFWWGITLVVGVVMGLLFAATGILSSITSGTTPSMGAIVGMFVVLLLVVLPLALWLGARLWVVGPVMAHARSINPIFGLTQAWKMTSGPVQWPILGTLLLFVIVLLIASMLLGMVGAIFTMVGGQVVGTILSGVITGVPVGIAGLAMNAGVFRALVPQESSADIFA